MKVSAKMFKFTLDYSKFAQLFGDKQTFWCQMFSLMPAPLGLCDEEGYEGGIQSPKNCCISNRILLTVIDGTFIGISRMARAILRASS